MRRMVRLRGFLIACLGVLPLGEGSCLAQGPLPTGCLPDEGVAIMWRETFLETRNLAEAGWKVVGQPSWRVVRESLDAGNGDLFSGPALILLPPTATEEHSDYLMTTFVWNTQREGRFFVAVRFEDPQNYYACEYVSSGGRLAVFLTKVRGGVRTVLDQLDSAEHTVHIPDLTYGAGKRNGAVISLGAFGDLICASVGGGANLQATDNELTSGGIALGHAEYHPFFDDVTVYLPSSQVPALELLPRRIEFRVPVPDRDEGNALVMDLLERGLSPCVLEEEEDALWVRLGPLASESEAIQARQYLKSAGYPFEEVEDTSSKEVF